MATIPEAIDYGARPSLRSDRVDIPGSGKLAVADALSYAADTFASVMIERKQKEDKFNYNMAKQELLTADVQQREALKDRTDWQEFDESYRTGLGDARDRITKQYALTPHDAAIFSAEADYIRERGASAVGATARKYEIDEKVGDLGDALTRARENIITMDPSTRNDQLLTTLDLINAGEEEGWLTDVDSQKLREQFTQDVAVASLTSMAPEDAIAVIKQSLANRAAGGPLTPEKIREGKGTGSIADFLHSDVANTMLDKLEREHKTTMDRGEAFAVVEEVFVNLPGLTNEKARMDAIRKALKGNPDALAIGVRSGRMRNEEDRGVDRQQVQELIKGIDSTIEENPNFTLDMVPSNDWERLTPGQKTLLEKRYSDIRNGQQFADSTNFLTAKYDENGYNKNNPLENLVMGSYALWGDLTAGQKASVDLSSPEWTTAMEEGVWLHLDGEQKAILAGKVTQAPGMTDDQILQSIVVGEGLLPQTGRTDAENQTYQRLRFRFRDAVNDESVRKYGGGKVPPKRRSDMLLEILGDVGYQRDLGWFGLDATLEQGEPLFAMTPEARAAGFIPMKLFGAKMTKVPVGQPEGPGGEFLPHQYVDMNWREALTNMSKTSLEGRVPSVKDMENAYFAIVSGMDDAEILRRLSGKGDE